MATREKPAQQRRPSTAKNKERNKLKKKKKKPIGEGINSSYTVGRGRIGIISLQRHLTTSMSGESEDPSVPAKGKYKIKCQLISSNV